MKRHIAILAVVLLAVGSAMSLPAMGDDELPALDAAEEQAADAGQAADEAQPPEGEADGGEAAEESQEEAAEEPEELDDPEESDQSEEESADPELERLRKADEEAEQNTAALVDRYKTAGSISDRQAVQYELTAAVNEHFDIRQQIREREIAALEKEIAELRDAIQRRNELRDKIVQRRVTELLGDDAEDLSF